MQDSLQHKRIGVLLLCAALTAACNSAPVPSTNNSQPATPPRPNTASALPSSPAPGAARESSTVTVLVDPARAGPPFDRTRTAVVPNGWMLSVWARTDKPRLAAWTPDGDLLVSVPSTGKVLRFVPAPDGPPAESVLLEGLDEPHGLAFAGSTLYVAQSNKIDAYDYTAGSAGNPRTVVGDLPNARTPDLRGAYAHALKSVAVAPDGAVYFSIGSTGNISAVDRTAEPPRATIMRVPPGGGPATAFATGVRNGTGLAVAPDGAVWTAVNGRDNVAFPGPGPDYGKVIPDYVDDHPPEQLAKLYPGRELGWPYCNSDVSDSGPAELPFIRDVQTNPDGALMDCTSLRPVEQSLGAHSAPLGLNFVDGALPEPFTRGALIGVHGSWNRQPPRAPEVSFFPWQDGDLGNQQTLVGGFQADDGSRWGRPVAALAGPDGAVYITDDAANAIYRLAPPD